MKFFDVFPKLRLPEELSAYLCDAEVVKVTKTSTNSLARVYLESSRLISKQVIYKTEDELKKHVNNLTDNVYELIDIMLK